MIDYLYPDWKTRGPKPIVANVFPPSRITEAQLAEAVLQALRTPHVHRMSPAWAVQAIYRETKDLGKNAADWALRFLQMEPSEYSVRWDVSIDVWGMEGTVEFSGGDIAHMCAFWVAKGFQFDKHNVDHLPEIGEQSQSFKEAGETPYGATTNELETEVFPLPLCNEVLQYVCFHEHDGHIFKRYMDIFCVDSYATYEFAIVEEGNVELIASSQCPVSRYLLELQLYAGLLPTRTSAPYIVSRRW